MPGSPVGPFVGSSWRQQTMLHVETFNMSDRVALNGQITCDERMCDRNTHEPFLKCTQANLAPKPPVFELQRMRELSRKHASLTIMHNDQTTIQTIHFKHNNTNTWGKTVPGINSNGISPTARTTCRTAPSCQILRGWYTSHPTRQSCISGKRGVE